MPELELEFSSNLNFDLPNSVVGARRLRDLQRIKNAIQQIDAYLSSLPGAANAVTTSILQNAISTAINELKGGVTSSGDTMLKLQQLINAGNADLADLLAIVTDQGETLNGKADTVHTHTKSQVGLANVDNTADIDKPVSTFVQSALDTKSNIGHSHTKADIGIVDGQIYSEDVLFCKKMKDLGFEIYLDPSITCFHIGRKVYTGNFQEWTKRLLN